MTGIDDSVKRVLLAAGHEKLAKVQIDLGLANRLVEHSQSRGIVAFGKALLPIVVECEKDEIFMRIVNAAGIARTESALHFLTWCSRWVQFHMPTVRLTSEQFAAFACTDIDEESLSDIVSPWPAFQIVFPQETFPVTLNNAFGEIAGERLAERITVLSFSGKFTNEEEREYKNAGVRKPVAGFWSTRIDVPGAYLDSTYRTVSELYDEIDFEGRNNGGFELSQLEKRAVSIGNRVALNVMLAMQQFKIERIPRKSCKARRTSGGTIASALPGDEYRIGAPIVCNVASSVRSYLRGETSRCNKVKWCVRGHWRNQPCGKNFTERKRTWVAPYHKGEGVRIIRDHVFA